jgi:hypothetical protein
MDNKKIGQCSRCGGNLTNGHRCQEVNSSSVLAGSMLWSVSVNVNGEDVLFISKNHLSGDKDIHLYAKEIREAAESLLAFIGKA